jgi:protein tyrosine/serine phosphatase
MSRTMIRRLAVVFVLLALAPAARAGDDWLNPSLLNDGLWRGRSPLLHRHYEQLKAMGIRTVVDIRGNQPVLSWIDRRRSAMHGLEYRHVPLSFHPLKDGSDQAVLATMQDVSAYPMYIHCMLDRDRSSAVIGVYRIRVQGWSQEAAEVEAKQFGIRRYFIGLNRYLRAAGGQ